MRQKLFATGQMAKDLQKEVQNGFFLEDDHELYNFMETYSS